MRVKAKRVKVDGYTYVETCAQTAARAAKAAKDQVSERHRLHLSGKRWVANVALYTELENA